MSNDTTAINGGEPIPQEAGRTFTQDELNRIVSERLAKEKGKLEASVVQKEKDLEQREMLMTAQARLAAEGYNPELLGAMNASNAEAFESSLQIIKQHGGILNPNPVNIPPAGDMPDMRGDPVREAMGLNKRSV